MTGLGSRQVAYIDRQVRLLPYMDEEKISEAIALVGFYLGEVHRGGDTWAGVETSKTVRQDFYQYIADKVLL